MHPSIQYRDVVKSKLKAMQAKEVAILNQYKGGALSAVRAQCNYLGVWPY